MTAMWGLWLTWLVAAFFVINGVVNLNPAQFRERLVQLGLPSWFYLFNGAFQILTGVLLAFERTRMIGFALAITICLVVFATLIRAGKFDHFGPITLLSFCVALAMWRLYA